MRGCVVGDFLVDHVQTRFVAFTGSKEIGVRIFERGAKVQPGQGWLKRITAEMGGKDAVIVEASADLDEAAEGIVAGAFGFSGQRCSAGSLAVLDERVYDEMAERIVARTQATVQVGCCIEPTIFVDLDPSARIVRKEIFGPVLAVVMARNFDHALEIATASKYGLTGSVYARDRVKLERAVREFEVGNLYLNRKGTGAMMGIHPFGGMKMSGTNTESGGPDYLVSIMEAKAVPGRPPPPRPPASART